jgi:hypothetical protein
VDGYKVVFDAYLGVKLVSAIKIDLSTLTGTTAEITVTEPANRLLGTRLVNYPYRLFPISNQVADKVCATLSDYRGKPSSREKDGVDLVVIALTQTPDADSLRTAIEQESRLRRVPIPATFSLPKTWGAAFVKGAKGTPAEGYDIQTAQELMDKLIGPILDRSATGIWNPVTHTWEG